MLDFTRTHALETLPAASTARPPARADMPRREVSQRHSGRWMLRFRGAGDWPRPVAAGLGTVMRPRLSAGHDRAPWRGVFRLRDAGLGRRQGV